MQVNLKYGKSGITLNYSETPNFQGVLYPKAVNSLVDPPGELRKSLENPSASASLQKVAAGRKDAVIVVSDITRPVPNRLLLPGIFEQLEVAGISRESITILIATGIHRPNEGEEIIQLVGVKLLKTIGLSIIFHRNRMIWCWLVMSVLRFLLTSTSTISMRI